MSCVCARKVWFYCPHCNDFAANIFNKNLPKLKIPFCSPSNYLIGRGELSAMNGTTLRSSLSQPDSRRAQRKIHGAWALSNLSNLRSLTILSKETSFVVEYWKYQIYKTGFVFLVKSVIYWKYSRLWSIGTSLPVSLLCSFVFQYPLYVTWSHVNIGSAIGLLDYYETSRL